MDFALFPYLKAELRGQRFSDLEELKRETLRILARLDQAWFQNVYQKWIARHNKCIEHNGEYFEKEYKQFSLNNFRIEGLKRTNLCLLITD